MTKTETTCDRCGDPMLHSNKASATVFREANAITEINGQKALITVTCKANSNGNAIDLCPGCIQIIVKENIGRIGNRP